jgi:DNA repair protein RadC
MKLKSNAELLALLIRRDTPSARELDAAQRLLRLHGGLRGLFRHVMGANPGHGAGLDRIAAAAELCRRRLLERLIRGEPLTSPSGTLDYLQSCLQDRRREVFTVLFLDTRHRVIAAEDLFQGTIDGACVYPRIVAERALRLGAAAVIVAHNHPSGIAEPSLADQAITRRLKDALGLLEIRLLDHFIIGDDAPVSLAERGML